jgi:integrase
MDDDLTLDAYLDEWLALQRTRIEPTTWTNYQLMARYYLRPRLGERRIVELTVRELDRHYVDLLDHGGRRRQGLSRTTIAYAHAVLHKALADGLEAGVLADNVAARATVPRVDPRRDALPRQVHTWDRDQVRRFLQQSADHELADLWRVALGTGMRRGELLGLRWDDVDLNTPSLQVATTLTRIQGSFRLKETKTRRVRRLHLDDDTAEVLARQPRRTGGPYPLVFTREDGQPLVPEVVTDRWRWQWPGLDVPRITLHGCRHTHATLLLQAGVPIKVVSERLGHTTIAMTMDIYAHVLPAMDRDAAAAYARLLRDDEAAVPGDQ